MKPLSTALIAAAALAVLALSAGCSAAPTAKAAEDGHDHASHESAAAKSETPAPEDRDPNRLWCRAHDVYEDECYICHPELEPQAGEEETADAGHGMAAPEGRDPDRLWCGAHGVYEDECTICHPEIAESGGAPGELWCNEHGVAESECGICQPQLLAEKAIGEGLKVRFPSEQSTEKAGVRVGPPGESAPRDAARLLGQVAFNQNALAAATPLAAGIVEEVRADVGDRVEAGQVLAVLRSPAIAEARSAYTQAKAEARLASETHAREQDLHNREISARRDLEAARAALSSAQASVEAAREQLLNLGLAEEDLDASGGASRLPVRAPLAGTIIERNAVDGAAAELGESLFRVADLSTMWMELSIPESRIAGLDQGAAVQARFEAYPGLVFEGRLDWIAYEVDPHTRMIEARAVLQNPQGLLRNGMFGAAALDGAPQQAAGLTVPEGAVQDVDGRPVVFARLADDLYETRLVTLGASQNGRVAVTAGLGAAESIAIEGSYIMKSEFLKARLGAGCADH